MRVLLVQGSSAGGVGRHVAAVATGLVEAGHDVVVAGPTEALDDFGLASTGAVCAPVEIGDRPSPRRDAAAVGSLRRLGAAADVVHAHGLRAGGLAALGLARAPRRERPPLVVTLHNLPVGGGRVQAVSAVLERLVARRSAAVLGVSGDLVQRMLDRGAPRAERALVPAPPGPPPSGPADEVRRWVREELGLDGTATALLVTVARLAPQKGLPLWCDALAELGRSRPDLDLLSVVAGDGPLRDALERRAATDSLPLRLLGRRADVADLFVAADVAVCPSVWEGQPLVVQEALRRGAPLVATDVGGTGEVAGDAALLVPYGDAGALATAVATLLDDPDERTRRHEAGLEQAAQLPTDADAVDQLDRLYRSLA